MHVSGPPRVLLRVQIDAEDAVCQEEFIDLYIDRYVDLSI